MSPGFSMRTFYEKRIKGDENSVVYAHPVHRCQTRSEYASWFTHSERLLTAFEKAFNRRDRKRYRRDRGGNTSRSQHSPHAYLARRTLCSSGFFVSTRKYLRISGFV